MQFTSSESKLVRRHFGPWTPSKVGLSVLEKAWGKGLSFHTPGKQDDFRRNGSGWQLDDSKYSWVNFAYVVNFVGYFPQFLFHWSTHTLGRHSHTRKILVHSEEDRWVRKFFLRRPLNK
jgi:hypothetical protein